MKIAIITKSIALGYGIDEVASIISKKLTESGYEVTILTTILDNKLISNQVTAKEIIPVRLPLLNQYWQRHFIIDLRCLKSFVDEIKEYDIILTCDPMHTIGAAAKIKLRKPTLMYYFGIVPHYVLNSIERKMESIRQTLLWNLSFQFADYVITNSSYTKSLLPTNIRRKAVVNYHGIQHLVLRRPEKVQKFREELNTEDKKLILSIGRFSTPYKGMMSLLKIFQSIKRKHKDTALLLVGGGKIPKDFREKIRSGEDVHILNNVPYDTLKLCLASCDIYCSASLWEGFNIPLIAAQANGKPVVALNVAVHPEMIINGETGFLARNYREFKNYVNCLIENDALRKQMGEKALIFTRKFTWERSVNGLIKLIEILKQKYTNGNN